MLPVAVPSIVRDECPEVSEFKVRLPAELVKSPVKNRLLELSSERLPELWMLKSLISTAVEVVCGALVASRMKILSVAIGSDLLAQLSAVSQSVLESPFQAA